MQLFINIGLRTVVLYPILLHFNTQRLGMGTFLLRTSNQTDFQFNHIPYPALLFSSKGNNLYLGPGTRLLCVCIPFIWADGILYQGEEDDVRGFLYVPKYISTYVSNNNPKFILLIGCMVHDGRTIREPLMWVLVAPVIGAMKVPTIFVASHECSSCFSICQILT